MVITLGFSKACIDMSKKIIIKAYDNVECSSKGIITLPIKVGPAIQNTIFQVLDLDLPYTLLLGRPWIPAMRVIPSTYHQFIKFPYNNTKITISCDPYPFQ